MAKPSETELLIGDCDEGYRTPSEFAATHRGNGNTKNQDENRLT
jgi:hypothetical protein